MSKTKTTIALIFGAVALIAAPASAAQGGTGTVTQLSVLSSTSGTYGKVKISNYSGTPPGCHISNHDGEFAFDLQTDKGKALLSLLQGALLGGKTVGIGGASSCFNVNGSETYQKLEVITVLP